MNVGDKVKISDFYRNNYPSWNVGSGIGTLTKVSQIEVQFDNLGKDERGLYVNKYGKQTSYPLFTLHVKLDQGPDTYVCSQFGVDKV